MKNNLRKKHKRFHRLKTRKEIKRKDLTSSKKSDERDIKNCIKESYCDKCIPHPIHPQFEWNGIKWMPICRYHPNYNGYLDNLHCQYPFIDTKWHIICKERTAEEWKAIKGIFNPSLGIEKYINKEHLPPIIKESKRKLILISNDYENFWMYQDFESEINWGVISFLEKNYYHNSGE